MPASVRCPRTTNLIAHIDEDDADDAAPLERKLRRDGVPVQVERVDTAEAMNAALMSASWDIVLSDM